MQIRTKENTFEVTLPDGRQTAFLKGTYLKEILDYFRPDDTDRIVLGRVNQRAVSLLEPLEEDCTLDWIRITDPEGQRSYHATLSLLLFRAAKDCFPHKRLLIDHSLGAGFYCQWRSGVVTKGQIKKLKARMAELIAADLPIVPIPMLRNQAVQQLETVGEDPEVYGGDPERTRFTYFALGDHQLPMGFPLYATTRMVRAFDLSVWSPGFILAFPLEDDPDTLAPLANLKKLFQVFHEYGKWEQILNVEKIAQINHASDSGEIHDLVKIAEGLHEKKIAYIADKITQKRRDLRVVLIAGPSSSGKTTFTKRLAIQLRVNGLRPMQVSLDNYFLDRKHTPLGPDGKPDYESLTAIDVRRLNRDLKGLLSGRKVVLRQYDFKTGEGFEGPEGRLEPGQPILMEGIHGLNDRLTSAIPSRNKLKIYVSALTQLNIMDHLRVPTSDVRLLRRMIRDLQFRNHTPEHTLATWSAVRRGEERNIFPYQEEADVVFNTSLMYELAVLRTRVLPHLEAVTPTTPYYSEAMRLAELLRYFKPLPVDVVPRNSILAEFVGGSSFEY